MSFVGVCQVCEQAEGRHTCDRCGSLVCAAHYATDLGVCMECAAAVRRGGDVDTMG